MKIEAPIMQLLTMLTYKRPHGSETESDFVTKFIIDAYPTKVELLGPMRNIVIVIGENPTTLFSCHTDTVHHKPGIQKIEFDPNMGHAYKKDGECLGADDGAGVWVMLQMIAAGVPGAYVFHRGEERGGIGSTWMAANKKDWLKTFKRAVAFDRKGEDSVITSQRGRRCCSDEFADALAAQLGEDWKKDPTGTFTDTANYTALIPECTNLSVGYYDQHTKDEMLNVDFLYGMVDIFCAVDWENLPTVREAKDEPSSFWGGYGGYSGSYSRGSANDKPWAPTARPKYDADKPYSPSGVFGAPTQSDSPLQSLFENDDTWDNKALAEMRMRDLGSLCKTEPYLAAAKILELLGTIKACQKSIDDLNEIIYELELENDELNEEVKDQTAELKELRTEVVKLGRKRNFNLPFWRQKDGN